MKNITNKTHMTIGSFITLLIVIINSGYAMTTGYARTVTFITAVYLVIVFLYCGNKRIQVFSKQSQSLTILCLMIVTIATTMLVTLDFDSLTGYLSEMLLITTAFVISQMVSKRDFAHFFKYFMRTVTTISCVLFFVIRYGYVTFPIIKNGYGVPYYFFLVFASQSHLGTLDYLRNSAIFWEAGMFAAFCLMALIAEIVLTKKTKSTKYFIIIYIIALISTKSTSAYVYIILSVFLLMSSKVNTIGKGFLFFISLTLVGLIYYQFDDIAMRLAAWNPQVFQKLVLENASVTDRFYSPIVDLIISAKHPFGVGYSNVTQVVREEANKYFNYVQTSRTSTLTYFFATFGLINGLVYNYAWVRGISSTVKNLTVRMLVIVSFTLLASSTPLNSNMAVYLMIFVLLKKESNMSTVGGEEKNASVVADRRYHTAYR